MVKSYQARPFFNAGQGSFGEILPRRKERGEPDYPFFALSQVSPSIYKGETPPSLL